MSPLEAWLYLDRMDLSQYWPANAPTPWDEFRRQFESGAATLEGCAFLSPSRRHAFQIALQPQSYLPSIPSIDVPRPLSPGLFPLNEPGAEAMVLVTANSALTFDVIGAVWAQGLTPAYLLLVDCLGNTVDMALVYGNFTGERLGHALEESSLPDIVSHRKLIVPGLAAPLAKDLRKATGWEVEVGPVSAAEIPLFLAERWIPS